MKKFIALFIIFILVIAFSACSPEQGEEPNTDIPNSEPEISESETDGETLELLLYDGKVNEYGAMVFSREEEDIGSAKVNFSMPEGFSFALEEETPSKEGFGIKNAKGEIISDLFYLVVTEDDYFKINNTTEAEKLSLKTGFGNTGKYEFYYETFPFEGDFSNKSSDTENPPKGYFRYLLAVKAALPEGIFLNLHYYFDLEENVLRGETDMLSYLPEETRAELFSVINAFEYVSGSAKLPEKPAKTDYAFDELVTIYGDFEYAKLEYNGYVYAHVIELDGKAYFTDTEADVITACDLKTGEVISEENFSDIGDMICTEKALDREGYDYKIYFTDRAIYRSSKDPEKKEEVILPDKVTGNVYYYDPGCEAYDIWGEKLVYGDGDNVFLKIGDGEVKEIINSSYFKDHIEFYKQTNTKLNLDFEGLPVRFGNPKFICGGEKIVIGVASDDSATYIGCGIYNIAAGKVEYWVDSVDPRQPKYPILDRFINDNMGENIIDAETYVESDLSFEGFNKFTYDYRTFIVCDYNSDEPGDPRTEFVAEFYNAETQEREKFFSANPNTALGSISITENYFLCWVYSTNGEELYAVKYK